MKMKLIDGLFKYGETVAIDVDGKLIKRKVHYADGLLYIDYDGKRIDEKHIDGVLKFDKAAYDMEYNRSNRRRFAVSVPKAQGDTWKSVAEDLGMSMNAFIIYCVEKEIHGE